MKVWIETDACTGSGLCAAIEPRVFAIGDDGLAQVIQGDADVPARYADRVWEASDCCPGDCIRVQDASDARCPGSDQALSDRIRPRRVPGCPG